MSKRLLDLFAGSIALLILSPVIGIAALAIRISMGSPVLFVQERPGLHGRLFPMYKFRTMLDTRDSGGNPLPDENRLTALGSFLRRTSIDELPEFLNVLKGDMSLVGPRPLLSAYLSLYNGEQSRRHEVRPGITGWAQVNGRNAIDWDEKFRLDVWYVDHQSMMLDLKILVLTVASVLRRESVSHQGSATMPEFTGSKTPADAEHWSSDDDG